MGANSSLSKGLTFFICNSLTNSILRGKIKLYYAHFYSVCGGKKRGKYK